MVKRDYSKGLIYKLVCNDTECKSIYVGSTTSFKHRKKHHKSDCNNENSKAYNYKIYQSIRANGGWDNWKMVLVEYYPCETKLELEKREREIYDELKANLNMIKPYCSKKERIENIKKNNKKWIDNNKEKIKEYKKKYRENNKEKIKEKIKCECGSIISKCNKPRHKRSQKHIKYMEQQK